MTRKHWNRDVDPQLVAALARQLSNLEADALARLIESNLPRWQWTLK
jgi:hypothetical protein